MKTLAKLIVAAGLWGALSLLSGPVQAQEGHEAEAAALHGEGHGEAAAHGEGHGEAPHINYTKLALQLFNFGVLLFILIKLGGGAVNKALLARHQQLKTDLDAATRARTEAEARLQKQEQRLASMEREIATMREGIKKEAEAEKARLIAAAEDRARRLREETRFAIEQQTKEAELALRHEAVDTALKIADEILRKSITRTDEERMLDGFVAGVGDGAAPRKMV